MPVPVIFALAAMVSWGIGDFLIQKTVKKIGAVEALFWIMAGGSLFLAPFVIKSLFLLNGLQFLLLFVLGLFFFLGTYIHFEALEIGKLSVVEVILSLELLLTILFGVVFFQERLSWFQTVSMLVLFLGIILISVNIKIPIRSRDFLEKGALLALIAAFFLGFINFLTALGAKEMDPLTTICVSWFVCGLVCSARLWRYGDFRKVLRQSYASKGLVGAMVLFSTLGWIFYAAATAGEALYLAAVITENFVIVAFFLGAYFNREKISGWQYIGAVLSVVASFLIGFVL
jgi:uncharacterized membrane protein